MLFFRYAQYAILFLSLLLPVVITFAGTGVGIGVIPNQDEVCVKSSNSNFESIFFIYVIVCVYFLFVFILNYYIFSHPNDQKLKLLSLSIFSVIFSIKSRNFLLNYITDKHILFKIKIDCLDFYYSIERVLTPNFIEKKLISYLNSFGYVFEGKSIEHTKFNSVDLSIIFDEYKKLNNTDLDIFCQTNLNPICQKILADKFIAFNVKVSESNPSSNNLLFYTGLILGGICLVCLGWFLFKNFNSNTTTSVNDCSDVSHSFENIPIRLIVPKVRPAPVNFNSYSVRDYEEVGSVINSFKSLYSKLFSLHDCTVFVMKNDNFYFSYVHYLGTRSFFHTHLMSPFCFKRAYSVADLSTSILASEKLTTTFARSYVVKYCMAGMHNCLFITM